MLSNAGSGLRPCLLDMGCSVQLRHVQYFVATVDAGSVSAASRALHVTQPALSRQLRQLEDELGVALFDRTAGRLTLSRTGQELLPAARQLLLDAQALRDAAEFHRHGAVQRLVIAAPTVTLTDVLSPFVADMRPDDPVVDVRSADGESPVQALQAGADLAVSTGRPAPPYESCVLADLPVWAYVRSDDPWAGRASVPLQELLTKPLVLPPSSFGARQALGTAVDAAGAVLQTVIEAANGTIAQALAATGRGVAVVSDDPRYDLRPLAIDVGDTVLTLRLVASWDGRNVARDTMAALAHRLQTWISVHYGP
jgi:DNA-binding transcriptional LysR family regulator